MAYRSFGRFWRLCHPPRYVALLKPSSPSLRHTSIDPDARSMATSGKGTAIVAHEVSDRAQLTSMR
ncbi:hypothetical protein [Mesorhizobium sp. M1273]|uniref:hypothetical protein n=1 Tax=Mesorhizobium sp. M1273 TaxID=2957075 RepID=UPI003337F9A3